MTFIGFAELVNSVPCPFAEIEKIFAETIFFSFKTTYLLFSIHPRAFTNA